MFPDDAMAWGNITWDFQAVLYPSPAEAQDCLVSNLSKIKCFHHRLPEALCLHPYPVTYIACISVPNTYFSFFKLLKVLILKKNPSSAHLVSERHILREQWVPYCYEQGSSYAQNEMCSDGLLAWNSRVERQTPVFTECWQVCSVSCHSSVMFDKVQNTKAAKPNPQLCRTGIIENSGDGVGALWEILTTRAALCLGGGECWVLLLCCPFCTPTVC